LTNLFITLNNPKTAQTPKSTLIEKFLELIFTISSEKKERIRNT
jgi:hypothetical protein